MPDNVAMLADPLPADPETRVLVVDDHRVVRAGLTAFLATEDGIEVVGEAADGQAALDELAVLERGGALPDVVLMDLEMPRMGGVEACRRARERWPSVEIVVVTSFADGDSVRAALEAGANGYVLKDTDADGVARAIRQAAAGHMHLDPAAARTLSDSLRAPRSAAETLTPREREVLVLVASGASNREVARHLGVTERTARTHVSNILAKLDLRSRTQAALWAVREGLAPAPDA